MQVTITEGGSTRVSSSAVAGSSGGGGSSGTNTSAIVGGVVGGVLGGLLILGLIGFFFWRNRRKREVALDEKAFDPGNRHSVSDPLDLLAPSVPDVGGGGSGGGAAGHGGSAPQVDPFPYGGNPANSAAYDPYSHAPMQMPDAQQYAAQGAHNPYGGYTGGSGEGGYGAAAAYGALGGAAGIGAGAAAYDHSRHGDYRSETGHSTSTYTSPYPDHSPTSSPHPSQGGFGGAGYGAGAAGAALSPAAAAKQREAAAERERQRMRMSQMHGGSSGGQSYGAGHSGNQPPSPSTEPSTDDRRASGMSDTGRSVYQHTDMGSVPDEGDEGPSEIPPNYNSIRQ